MTAIAKRIGQYHYSDPLHTRIIDGVQYTIGIATAYNAHGLIGPEHNGVFVLNETQRCVVADKICPQGSGYFGSSESQRATMKFLLKLDAKGFKEYLARTERFRGEHTLRP